MKYRNIVPIFLISTAALTGCESLDNGLYTNDDAFFPESNGHIAKNAKYQPCYADGAIILRGAPLDKKEKFYKREGRVAVFPSPRIPRGNISDISPRDLYSNLASKDPQVRSDTLYVIDKALQDTNQGDREAQLQGMLDDYIKNLTQNKNSNPAELDIANDIYNRHFQGDDKTLNRPNWKGMPSSSFAGHGITDTVPAATIAKIPSVSYTDAKKSYNKTPTKDITEQTAKVENAPSLAETPMKKISEEPLTEKETIQGNNEKRTISKEELPDFDFTDPKESAFVEKTELEVQMEKNKELSKQKNAEDALIDKDISAVLVEDELADWSCTQNMCATRLQESSINIETLIAESKSVLSDKTSRITPRLYAICNLKCASQADKKYESDVIGFLSNYLRRRTPWIIPEKGQKEPAIKAVRPDVQAALYVVGARDRMKNLGFDINLIGTDLRGADLSFANLYNTNLSFTNLSAANLQNAYGLLDWNKVYLATIDVTTKIPQSIFAGFVVTKKPSLPIQPAGSYTVTSDDWIYWKAIPVK